MNVVGTSHKALSLAGGHNNKGIKEENGATNNNTIQLYDEAPMLELSLDQFEEYALKRLKVCC